MRNPSKLAENPSPKAGAAKATPSVADLMAELEREGLPDAPDLPPAPAIELSPAPPAADDAPYDEIEIAVSSPEPVAPSPSEIAPSPEPELPRARPSSEVEATPAEPPAPRPAPTPTSPFKRTPSVADLMAELDQEEAAASERSWTWLQVAAGRLIELDQRKATLSAHRDPADPMRSHFLEAARQAASKAGGLLDEKQEAEGQEATLREQLLEAFLALQRLIGELDGTAAEETAPGEPKRLLRGKTSSEQKAVPAQALRVEPLLKAERARRRRIIAMATIIGILVLARAGLYLWDHLQAGAKPLAVELAHAKGASALAVTEALRAKTPTLVSLHLVVTEGGLRALAVAASAASQPKVTYTWYQDGEILATEETGRLPTSRLKPGARYKVEASATLAGRSTNRLESPLVHYQPTSVNR